MSNRRDPSPTLRRRRLGAELRSLRKAANLTAAEAAKILEWGETKILYLEGAKGVLPKPRDIEDLCDRVYGVSDPGKRAYLIRLARDARLKGWWHPYTKMLSSAYTTYIGLEAEVDTVLSAPGLMLPGLGQTEDYAKALIVGGPAEISAEEVDRRIAIRAERQKILTAADPARLWAVLDEAAIRRIVGSRKIMRSQLQHLLELTQLPKVSLQVIPFEAGAHPGVGGPFTILSFPHDLDPDAVYVEAIAGELFVEDADEVEMFKVAFQRLTAAALSLPDTIAMIAAAAADL